MKTYFSFAFVLAMLSTLQNFSFAEANRAGETAPDNLRVSQRDKIETAVPSRQITRQIRKELRNDDSLSRHAKSIQIVTNAKSVTLRGPVSSDEEKAKIEEIAQKVSVNREIKNELEVK